LSALTSYRHQIQAGDIAVILDSLQELFRERGDAVTPKQLAERMENKIHRHVHYTYATYLCTLLGFVTRNGIEAGTRIIVTSFSTRNCWHKNERNIARFLRK